MTTPDRTQAAREQFGSIITHIRVSETEIFGAVSVFDVEIFFVDASRLIIRDYTFLSGSRKYSFQYQDVANTLRFRYDNEPHWKSLSNFPFHKHSPSGVESSVEMTVEMVLEEIARTVFNLLSLS
jgi:Family of unknown function (DUF6516)